MTISEYNLKILEIEKELELPKNEFFDIEFCPERPEILDLFNFYITTLEQQSYYGISPCFIYINNYRIINARAGVIYGKGVITINCGLLFWLFSEFKNKLEIDTYKGIKLFELLKPRLDLPISKLMYQTGLHFTFYHEMAHLVQKSEQLTPFLDEKPQNNEEYSKERHLLELDADEFSSLCIGTHTMQYAEKLFNKSLNASVFEGIICLILIPIILYLISFSKYEDDIYFETNTHPHPSIRLINIALTITHYCNQSLKAKKYDFQIDQFRVITYALEIAHELDVEFYQLNRVEHFRKILSENRRKISKYIHSFVELKKNNDSLSVSKWNFHKASLNNN